MPGVKVGAYSVVGSGVVLHRDVKDNTLIYVKQELIEEKWGVDKYGW
jgi:UDP-N-acetylglucosamine diphosphorylase / glucose-1-phosphate thymidylyltransferase / UDP-N-acetylgalactosamine diphosphorylase / glucosamine-1-phosphate N-acetyltransferase / galactosamine-1-phosphate N-acetyltransferase